MASVVITETANLWDGTLTNARATGSDIVLVVPLQMSQSGGSGAFLGRANDGKRYFIKPLNNLHGPKICVTEQIVGRVGKLIGAPVCTVQTMEIPKAFEAWPYRHSGALVPGIAHASLAVGNVLETRFLEYRSEDDNASRHAGIFALYDWCWGGDEQWLMDLSDEKSYSSHDHGYYLPPTGQSWTQESLLQSADAPHELPGTRSGVSRGAVAGIADALRNVTRQQLREVLVKIPSTWPVSDEELETVGCFLEHRAPNVADRLESRFLD